LNAAEHFSAGHVTKDNGEKLATKQQVKFKAPGDARPAVLPRRNSVIRPGRRDPVGVRQQSAATHRSESSPQRREVFPTANCATFGEWRRSVLG
jgi:hypothetical protein